MDIMELNKKIEQESAFVDAITSEISKVIVGQKTMVRRLIMGLLANGHILLEGVPGLAKTQAITALAKSIDAKFSRIQFTPDLLPADITGTMIYSPKDETFSVKKGPIFSNFVLADEINRAPAKVQSALLEAMQERQVTIGETTFKLEEPFLVLATGPFHDEGCHFLSHKGRRKRNTSLPHHAFSTGDFAGDKPQRHTSRKRSGKGGIYRRQD